VGSLLLAAAAAVLYALSLHDALPILVVVARMVGMVVGLALLTAVGLRRFQEEVAGLADPTDADAMLDAAVVQVQTVFAGAALARSEEHTSELQSRENIVCRLLLEKKK